MKHLLLCALWFALMPAMAADRIVAHLGAQPVLESQLQGATDRQRADHLYRLVVAPAVEAHLKPHASQLLATGPDIDRFLEVLRARRQCRGMPDRPEADRRFAEMAVPHLKLQRFLYLHHGGGRVRFQQVGHEAFDATRTLVLALEKQGRFAIHDPGLRALALAYWLEANGPLGADPGPDKAFTAEHVLDPCPPR